MLAFSRRFGSGYPMIFLSEYTTAMLNGYTVNVPQLTAVSSLLKRFAPLPSLIRTALSALMLLRMLTADSAT